MDRHIIAFWICIGAAVMTAFAGAVVAMFAKDKDPNA